VFLGTCRRRRRREGLGMRTAPKALNFRAKRGEFNSALTLRRRARARRRCVPRRVSASAKARRLGNAHGAEGAELPRESRRV